MKNMKTGTNWSPDPNWSTIVLYSLYSCTVNTSCRWTRHKLHHFLWWNSSLTFIFTTTEKIVDHNWSIMWHLTPDLRDIQSYLHVIHCLLLYKIYYTKYVNVLRPFAPWNFRTPGTFAPKTTFGPLTFTPVELSLPYLKKLWKGGKQYFGKCSLLFTWAETMSWRPI